MDISFLPPMGPTKTAEYNRSIEMMADIFKKHEAKGNGAYYVLAFLYDSEYDRADIAKMMELCKPKK
jgi:hypothetical protein